MFFLLQQDNRNNHRSRHTATKVKDDVSSLSSLSSLSVVSGRKKRLKRRATGSRRRITNITTAATATTAADAAATTIHHQHHHQNHHLRKNRNNYVLKRMISNGSFGTVYEAEYNDCQKATIGKDIKKKKKNKTIVAIKIVTLSSNHDDDGNSEEDVYNEALVQRKLRSIPNVVFLIDFFIRRNKAYFVQELVEGGNVLDRLLSKKDKRYSETNAKKLIKILLQTVRELHKIGIVHRDLKLENLLLQNTNDDTSIKICDFGDATRLPTQTLKKTTTTSSATLLNDDDDDERQQRLGKLYTCCGSPAFMAPEINIGNGYREEVDMWSIGCILFMLIGGYAPFGYDHNQAYENALRCSDNTNDNNYHHYFNSYPWSQNNSSSRAKEQQQQQGVVSNNAKEIVSKLLTVNPINRWTASEALNCQWFFLPSPKSSITRKTKKNTYLPFYHSLSPYIIPATIGNSNYIHDL